MTDPSHAGELHQIGAVAERVGLSLRTIRHYDEIGLVVPSGRSPGGFRLYTDDDVDRLLHIKAMKPLGFSLEEHAVLLAHRDALVAGRSLEPAELDHLRASAERADERCAVLQRQLTEARRLTATLWEQVAEAEQRRPGSTDAP